MGQYKVNGENATPQIKIYECKTAPGAPGFSSTATVAFRLCARAPHAG